MHLSLLLKRLIKQIHLCELVVPVVAGWGGQVGHEDEELLLCTGLENFLIHLIVFICQIRICDGCGARLRSTYIRTHQLRYCHGPAAAEPDQSITSEAGSEIDSEEEQMNSSSEEEELDEIMGEVNDEDQTLLGAGLGGATAEEEEQAQRLQERLSRQRQQRERTPPRAEAEEAEEAEERWADLWGRYRALHRPPARRQRMASPSSSSSSPSHDSPSSSDSSRVVDEDGRPVIPDAVDPLPLDLTGVLLIKLGFKQLLCNSAVLPPPGVQLDSFGLPLLEQSLSPAGIYWLTWLTQSNLCFNSGVLLTPPPPATPSLLDFSLSPSMQRLVSRPLRLESHDTPNAGRILDLDRESMTSVVSRLSGRGQVSVMVLFFW